MNQKQIEDTKKELKEIISGINQTITELDKINPNEPISSDRNKMIQDFYFASDVAKYGKMVLNEDYFGMYEEFLEMFRDD